jgi:trk system potassium uptake protein TrkH
MNRPIICRFLGLITLLIGGSMVMSLPWALPVCGEANVVEIRSLEGLGGAMVVCGLLGGLLMYLGRGAKGLRLYRKEAIAVVGLSWVLATLLGALPFWLSNTCRGRDEGGHPVPMDLTDGLFESGSGFSGTGATVLTDLEDPELVPRAILFWRSQTHFLGGLGIMVLFVAILGLGSAGKALMMTEMPGPSTENTQATTQRAAWVFSAIFIGLTTLLTVILVCEGLSLFDALCHSFGAIATGGYSTYNASIAHFDSIAVEATLGLFMVIACTNFTLLYYVLLWQPKKLLVDAEFRTYLAILFAVGAMVTAVGWSVGDFDSLRSAIRYGFFQVISVMTNTGFGTHDFDHWNNFNRAALLLLMFIGGCAGSTSCSIKVIRHMLLVKILWLELEKVFRPRVVRYARVGGKPVEDPELREDVLVYFCVILLIFVAGWMALVAIEPDQNWVQRGLSHREKLTDCASAVAATLNGVGPGLGVVGESQNYALFHPPSKLVLTCLMLLGRLEVFVLLVWIVPRFWRNR